MKKLNTTNYLVVIMIAASVMVASCSSADFELSKTVFVEDVDYPGLPIYSEWGYNTFGAYIDRNVFTSSSYVLPTKIIVNTDTFKLYLKGMMNNQPTTIKFEIKGYAPADYPDLISLNDSVINLKSSDCKVTLENGSSMQVLRIIEGNIRFKRVQNLYVDKSFAKTIVSGTFNFKTFFDGEPVAITNGRFDLGIGYENFYNF